MMSVPATYRKARCRQARLTADHEDLFTEAPLSSAVSYAVETPNLKDWFNRFFRSRSAPFYHSWDATRSRRAQDFGRRLMYYFHQAPNSQRRRRGFSVGRGAIPPKAATKRARSAGSGLSKAIGLPVTGCSKPRCAACKACRPSASRASRAGSTKRRALAAKWDP